MNTGYDPREIGVESLNPFTSAPVAARPTSAELAVATQSAREVAEVQAGMIMARRFPRVEVEVVDRILQACTRPTLAEGALYEYSRGGSDIRGPSIRLAECIAQYWGHLDFGWRVLEERPGATKVQTFAWDLQTGTRAQAVFDVVHETIARGQRKILYDPRDIYEHVANAASRRLRACILRVVPGDVVEAAVRQCEVTLKTKAEVTPERLKNLVDQFAELGVPKAAIEKRIQRRLESITPGLMVQLGKIYTSLRDNMSQPGDWFDLAEGSPAAPEPAGAKQPGKEGGSGASAVKSRLEARKQAAKRPEPEPAPRPVQEPPPPQPADYSDAFLDTVNFAKAAASMQDVERAAQIATQIADPDEATLAQEHLDAARKRLRS